MTNAKFLYGRMKLSSLGLIIALFWGLKQSMIEFKRKKSTNKVFYFVNPYLKLYFDVLSYSIQGSNSTSNKQISDESFLTGSVGINVTVGSDREN